MAIEDLIANGIQPPQIITPFQLMAGQQELEQNKLLNIARKRSLDEKMRQDVMRQGINRLYQQYGNDNQALIKAAAQQGYGEMIPQFVEQENARLKEARLQEKDGLENIIKKGQYIASRLRSATPENWEQTVSEIEQDTGSAIPRLHFAYDKNKVDSLINEGLSNTQAVEMEYKKRYADLQERQFEYGQQKDAAQMDIQRQNAENQQQWNQANFEQRDRQIEATRINKPISPMQTKANDAEEMGALISQAMPLIEQSTGGYIGAGIDQFNRAFGASDKGARAAAQLKVIGGAIVSKMPKPPGPASDRDIQLAQEQGARLGDPTVTQAEKIDALKALQEINARQIERAKQAGLIQQDAQTQTSQTGLGGGASGDWGDSNDPFAGFTPEEKALYLKQYGGR